MLSNLSTVRFVAYQQHFQLFDILEQEFLEATGEHVLCFFSLPTTSVGGQGLAFDFSPHPVFNTSGLLLCGYI